MRTDSWHWFLTLTAIAFVLLGMCGGCVAEGVGSVCAEVVGGVPSTDPRATVDVRGCTGTLIAPDVVLSAAHCGPRSSVLIDGERFEVVESIIHPEYVREDLVHDLALHRLALDVEHVQAAPISLPALGDALVQGYGVDETGKRTGLREATTTIVDFEPGHRIITGPGPDSCFGDSGGPLYQQGALVGVVSSGVTNECGEGGTYIAPAAYINWFESNGVGFTTTGETC